MDRLRHVWIAAIVCFLAGIAEIRVCPLFPIPFR